MSHPIRTSQAGTKTNQKGPRQKSDTLSLPGSLLLDTSKAFNHSQLTGSSPYPRKRTQVRHALYSAPGAHTWSRRLLLCLSLSQPWHLGLVTLTSSLFSFSLSSQSPPPKSTSKNASTVTLSFALCIKYMLGVRACVFLFLSITLYSIAIRSHFSLFESSRVGSLKWLYDS